MTARLSLKASPPDHLRAKCALMLPRLQLIPEFEPWLDVALEHYLSTNAQTRPTTQAALILWHCFALGAPLCVLLDMLGNANRHRDTVDAEPEALVQTFINGVLSLEAQGRLSHGEILHSEDIFSGTYQGFAKVCPYRCSQPDKARLLMIISMHIAFGNRRKNSCRATSDIPGVIYAPIRCAPASIRAFRRNDWWRESTHGDTNHHGCGHTFRTISYICVDPNVLGFLQGSLEEPAD